jgi:hypothetical protein
MSAANDGAIRTALCGIARSRLRVRSSAAATLPFFARLGEQSKATASMSREAFRRCSARPLLREDHVSLQKDFDPVTVS